VVGRSLFSHCIIGVPKVIVGYTVEEGLDSIHNGNWWYHLVFMMFIMRRGVRAVLGSIEPFASLSYGAEIPLVFFRC